MLITLISYAYCAAYCPLPGVLAELEEGEPLHHDVGAPLLLFARLHLKPGGDHGGAPQGLHGHGHHHTLASVTFCHSLSLKCHQSPMTTHFHRQYLSGFFKFLTDDINSDYSGGYLPV